MDKYIDRFPDQLLEAVRIAQATEVFTLPRHPAHIVISGMGGSGIGAVIVRSLVGGSLKVPYAVVNNYAVPQWCNADTLVICSSYSGNTEETLASMEDARKKGCMIACVTTGGAMLQIARDNGYPVVIIPGGMPPRSCLGYSVVGQLCLLHYAGMIDNSWQDAIVRTAHFLRAHTQDLRNSAKEIAKHLQHTIPVIYADGFLSGVAVRWKQQLNENAKMHAFDHVIPEMNHNELVAYDKTDERFSAVFLRSGFEHPRIAQRFSLTEELIRPKTGYTTTVHATGDDRFCQLFSLIHLGDWLSVELAILNGADPIDIAILDWLKAALAKT